MRFVLSKSSNNQFYFEIQAGGNYATLATSETYRTKDDAETAINLIVIGAADADIVDNT